MHPFMDADDTEDWNLDGNGDEHVQGYQALLDPDEDEDRTSTVEDEEDEPQLEEEQEAEDDDADEEEPADDNDGQIKPFCCTLCSISFSKFEVYREHFVSTEHRYKRRDEKKRLGEGCFIESSPVEVFVNLLLYNKVPFESVQIDVQPVDFSVSGSLEYNHVKYDYQHAPSLNDLYQQLTSKLNQDYERHQLKMPPPSFFVARDVCRRDVDNVWTVARHCDDAGKSDDEIVKELLDFCVFNSIQPERERLVAHSIQTWRMFHRHEAKAGFWCDICKQCFRKRKAIICHLESSEKHEQNLKHLPPYRRAVQHSLFTGRLLNEFIAIDQLNHFRTRVNAYRIPPSNKNLKNAYYCTFCKKSFESAFALEKHLGWKGHRDLLKKRRQHDSDNLLRLATYLNFNQLTHEQRNGGIQQMAKTPEEYCMRYHLEPITVDNMQEDTMRFDTQLAQQVMNNIHNQQGTANRFPRGGGGFGRGRGRGRPPFRGQPFHQQQQTFRPRANFQQPYQQNFHSGPFQHSPNYQGRPSRSFNNNNMNNYNGHQFNPQSNFHLPTSFRPHNATFNNGQQKRPYPQNEPSNHYNNNNNNQWQAWPNKRPRFDRPSGFQQAPSSNRVDYRYVANQNTFQQQQRPPFP